MSQMREVVSNIFSGLNGPTYVPCGEQIVALDSGAASEANGTCPYCQKALPESNWHPGEYLGAEGPRGDKYCNDVCIVLERLDVRTTLLKGVRSAIARGLSVAARIKARELVRHAESLEYTKEILSEVL